MMDEKQVVWERYKHEVELHRGYLDLAIKLNLFFYAITGAIISFFFLHIGEEPLLKWSLILPFFMALFLAKFFFDAAQASKLSQQEIQRLSDILEFNVFSAAPEILRRLLMISFSLMIISSLGLFIAFFKDFELGDFFNCVHLAFNKDT